MSLECERAFEFQLVPAPSLLPLISFKLSAPTKEQRILSTVTSPQSWASVVSQQLRDRARGKGAQVQLLEIAKSITSDPHLLR